jgi:hypothetical protein
VGGICLVTIEISLLNFIQQRQTFCGGIPRRPGNVAGLTSQNEDVSPLNKFYIGMNLNAIN